MAATRTQLDVCQAESMPLAALMYQGGYLTLVKVIDADISGERQSSRGRADAILKDRSGVYVFEFKYGKTAREALDQARAKDYAGPWLDGDPPVFYVGVNYDPAKHGIDDPLVEKA